MSPIIARTGLTATNLTIPYVSAKFPSPHKVGSAWLKVPQKTLPPCKRFWTI